MSQEAYQTVTHVNFKPSSIAKLKNLNLNEMSDSITLPSSSERDFVPRKIGKKLGTCSFKITSCLINVIIMKFIHNINIINYPDR